MIRTLTEKVIEGIRSQSWEIIGRGGTWAGAMRPLEIYIQRKVERAVKAEREACADLCKYVYTEVLDDREGVAKLCEEYILGRNSA